MLPQELLHEFELGLNPKKPGESKIPARIVGYGEISAIFALEADVTNVYKRMPLFGNLASARQYQQMYLEYCGLLEQTGLSLPPHETCIVDVPDRPVTLYIAQKALPTSNFAHVAIHELDHAASLDLIQRVIAETNKVWSFNQANEPEISLAIDGQLSNWVRDPQDPQKLYYVDTSTPLYCRQGKEQQDPELLIQSAPGFLRWIIWLFFLDDVMTRYYVPRLVFMDLVANLYKEQKPELIELTITLVNKGLPVGQEPLTKKEVDKYYKEDKLIWTVFLALRRFDRFITTNLLRKRYEFILPGKIKR